jgi:hypothetical protein
MASKAMGSLAIALVQQQVSVGLELQAAADVRLAANPIRKVVNMLKKIQTKVEDEGAKETKMHDEYVCYCKNGAADLEAAIAGSTAKVPELQSSIEESEAQAKQLVQDLTKHKTDREAAKQAMATAGSLRAKEASAFATYKADAESNLSALRKAITAVESGSAGAFLQSDAAATVQNIVKSAADMVEVDREDVVEFLQASHSVGYSPASGEITGVLKQLEDRMAADLAAATSTENGSIESFEGLMSAKAKEIGACTQDIETKTIRSGELAVDIVNMKHDLTDTETSLIADKDFLANLDKNCAAKAAEWNVIVKTRSEELVALAETISLLTNDESLEMFKKALPGAAASLVQVKMTKASANARALAIIHAARSSARLGMDGLDLIAVALHGRKGGFEKVLPMIDGMIDVLKKEQVDDDNKSEYCKTHLDSLDDQRKGLDRSVANSGTAIADAEEAIATISNEIEALEDGIKKLDASVADASEQRKNENEDFAVLVAQDTAAVELIGLAKNRLHKFYAPNLYAPPPKRELSADDRIMVNMGGTAPPTPAPGGIAGTDITALVQVSVHSHLAGAPEAPAAYSKSEESNGVIAMMDLLLQDLEKEMTVARTEEQDAQRDYTQMLQDSKDKRVADTSSLTDKGATKADMEAALQAHRDDKESSTSQLVATLKLMQATHVECDWLLKYHAMRNEARDAEIESLQKAKAVLSGADYSLLQTRVHNLRGRS